MYVSHVSCIGGVWCIPFIQCFFSNSLSVFSSVYLGVPPRQSSAIPNAQSPNEQRMYMYIIHSATPIIITDGKKMTKCPYFMGKIKGVRPLSSRGVLRKGFHRSTDAVI